MKKQINFFEKTNELNNKSKYGISLITLIITIIVMIILAMVVIVAISNRAEGARKARFYNDITISLILVTRSIRTSCKP